MSNKSNAVKPDLPDTMTLRQAALVEMDIMNCRAIAVELGSEENFALFIDGFYTICSDAVTSLGGEVVKYAGDACLAIFDEDCCVDALDSILKVREAFPALCEKFALTPTGIRATVHTGEVVHGRFGPEGHPDVLGKATSELFHTIGRGITITEQVYRKLPNDRRGPWKKVTGKVVYMMK